jgi:HEAT repeat protein
MASGSARGTGSRSSLPTALRAALHDDDPLVVAAACVASGERRDHKAIDALGLISREHTDTRCREDAVAALGAIGDRAGLPFVLSALDDKPTVRRRATVALAAFEGEEVEAALQRSLADRDWQVREVAEILTGEPPIG